MFFQIAIEMGIDTTMEIVEAESKMSDVAEPLEPYNPNAHLLKTAFLAQATSQQKIDVLVKVAREMGIRLFPISDEQVEDILFSQHTLSEEWNSAAC